MLEACAAALAPRRSSITGKAARELTALLSSPLEAFGVVATLSLSSYPGLVALLEDGARRHMGSTIIRTILKTGAVVTDQPKVRSRWKCLGMVDAGPQLLLGIVGLRRLAGGRVIPPDSIP